MKNTSQTHAPVDDHSSLSDMLASQTKFQASQKLRLKSYIEATQPELAAAYERESTAFKHLSEAVLKPILTTVANTASRKSWQAQLIEDKDEDGIFGFATPGVRLLVSQKETPILEPISASEAITYLGFHGCCPGHAVKVVTEIHGANTEQSAIQCERLIDYSVLSIEEAKEIISDFLLQVGVVTSENVATFLSDVR